MAPRLLTLSVEPAWHSPLLSSLYDGLGWLAFVVWSLSFYPQVALNYKRKSVVGLNFDFVVFNLTKHTSYLIFNAALFFSPVVQRQYHEEYGEAELIPVSASDVAFSIHAVTLTLVTALQIIIYDRGGQRVSLTCRAISGAVWLLAALCFAYAWHASAWLWLVTQFNYLQVLMTSIKYVPQAWFNAVRRSTVGWSISNVLLDIAGGLASYAMMLLQSLDQGSFVNFTGNVGKLLLSLETVGFDTFFILQHYVLYPQPHPATAAPSAGPQPPLRPAEKQPLLPARAAGADEELGVPPEPRPM